MKILKFFAVYISVYWFLGALCWVTVFGFHHAMVALSAPPNVFFSARLVGPATLVATILALYFKKEVLSNRPYDYFIFGFYVGNLSLIIMFVADAFLRKLIIWKFPEFLLLFFAPFLELFFAYLFGSYSFNSKCSYVVLDKSKTSISLRINAVMAPQLSRICI